jgi:hypothetical protein
MTLSYIKRNQFYECIFKAVELKNKTTVTIERKEEETVINFFQLIIFHVTHKLKKNDQLLLKQNMQNYIMYNHELKSTFLQNVRLLWMCDSAN